MLVRPKEDGERLDRILAARGEESRATYQRWIREGRVCIDGVVETSPRTKGREGQTLLVRPAPPPSTDAVPQDIPIDVLHHDGHIIVLNKAAGMVVHPAPGHPDGTLVNALLHRFGRLAGGAAERPGIVHRLDMHTSGVMVVARTTMAQTQLAMLFAAHNIERAYVAIAVGEPPDEVTYDTLHGRHRRDRKKFSTRVERGKRAVTHVRVLERLHGAARIECRLETGRTHQIRVHLAEHGFPLLGDPVYGRRSKDKRLSAAGNALGRQALHAVHLGFIHPATKSFFERDAPPPPDFVAALTALRSRAPE